MPLSCLHQQATGTVTLYTWECDNIKSNLQFSFRIILTFRKLYSGSNLITSSKHVSGKFNCCHLTPCYRKCPLQTTTNVEIYMKTETWYLTQPHCYEYTSFLTYNKFKSCELQYLKLYIINDENQRNSAQIEKMPKVGKSCIKSVYVLNCNSYYIATSVYKTYLSTNLNNKKKKVTNNATTS